VRFGFPTMILASAGLHLAVVGALGISWSVERAAHSVATETPDTTPVLVWTQSQEVRTPTRLARASAPPLPIQAAPLIASTLPVARPETDVPANTIAPHAAASPHVRPMSFDTDLAPSPAPHVDSRQGVVFILDVSGSMFESYAGTNRLAVAQQVLARSIEALPDGTPFAIVCYGERAQVSGPLVAASRRTRAAALNYLAQEFDLGGGTNLPSGLDAAETLHPGRLVIATDGDLNAAPWRILAAGRQLLEQEPRPAVTIWAISPRPKTGDGAILRSLASQQLGHYFSATLDSSTGLLTADVSPGVVR